MSEWVWAFLGIKAMNLFAGLAGGVVGCWVDGKSSLRDWVGYIGCGGLTGAYLAEPATHLIPYTSELAAGFIMGSCSILVLRMFRGIINRYGVKLISGNGTEGK